MLFFLISKLYSMSSSSEIHFLPTEKDWLSLPLFLGPLTFCCDYLCLILAIFIPAFFFSVLSSNFSSDKTCIFVKEEEEEWQVLVGLKSVSACVIWKTSSEYWTGGLLVWWKKKTTVTSFISLNNAAFFSTECLPDSAFVQLHKPTSHLDQFFSPPAKKTRLLSRETKRAWSGWPFEVTRSGVETQPLWDWPRWRKWHRAAAERIAQVWPVTCGGSYN